MSIRIYFLTVRQIMRRIGEVRNWVESYYNLCHGEVPQYRNHSRALTREHFRDIYLLFQSISNATLLYISATCTTGSGSEAYTHISFNLNIVCSVAQDPHSLFLVTISVQRYKRQRQDTEQNLRLNMSHLPNTSNCGLRMRLECRERFSRHCRLAIPTSRLVRDARAVMHVSGFLWRR